jgi:hypothetical protein
LKDSEKNLGKDVCKMTALELRNYLKAHYPKENEAFEWKNKTHVSTCATILQVCLIREKVETCL